MNEIGEKILHISLSFAFLYLPNPHVHPFILGVASPAAAHQSPAHFLLSPSHTTIINTIITIIIPHRYCDHHLPISPPLTPSPLWPIPSPLSSTPSSQLVIMGMRYVWAETMLMMLVMMATIAVLSNHHLMFVPSFPSSTIICPKPTFYKSSGHRVDDYDDGDDGDDDDDDDWWCHWCWW